MERLANGNTLIVENTPGRITEVDSSGGIVWEKTELNYPEDVESITINGPTADFSANPKSGPATLEVSFIDNSISGDGIVSWFWDFGDGSTSSEQNPTHNYIMNGTYTVSLRVTDLDGDNDIEIKTDYIKVESVPPESSDKVTNTPGFEVILILVAIGFIVYWRKKYLKR